MTSLLEKPPTVSTNNVDFVLGAVHAGLRVDGRKLAAMRKLECDLLGNGVALVQLGNTKVLCGVSAEIGPPTHASRGAEGVLGVFVDFAGVLHEGKQRHTNSQLQTAALIESNIRESGAVDLESLCIVADESVWRVRADVKVIDYDGNAADACVFATLMALQHFRRAAVSVVGDKITVHEMSARQPVPLQVLHQPYMITYAFFADAATGSTAAVVDPSAEEEQACMGTLSVSVNEVGEVCSLRKPGGIEVEAEMVVMCCKQAVRYRKQLAETATRVLAVAEMRRREKRQESMHFQKAKRIESVEEDTGI
jgi:exosome complex component RRP45